MKYLLFYFVLFLVLLTACYESEPVDIGGKPLLFKLQDSNTCYLDTLILYGEHLGLPADSSYLVFNDTTIIQSKDCLHWTASKIELIIPKLPKESTIYVVCGGKIVFYDSIYYKQKLHIAAFPAFDFVLVPAGNFDMGSVEYSILSEQPVHNVILSVPLYVSAHEITQHLYCAIMGNSATYIGHSAYPAYDIAWIDAIRFCNALSLASDLTPAYTIVEPSFYVSFDTAANGWRLPTEAEWEYCAGDANAGEDLKDYAWFANNSALTPKTIGLLKPNSRGLYDMLGNVWEWCWDYYSANYYNISPIVNPTGAATGTSRAIRGGSSDDEKIVIRKQYRASSANILDVNGNAKIGFRIVRKATI